MESQKKAKLIKLLMSFEGKSRPKPKKISLQEAKKELIKKDLDIDISTMLQELNYGRRDEALIGVLCDNLLTPLLLKLLSKN
ncbi:MAG: hypothetical protein ACLFQJ_01150 [Campylobacterales bacterium]